MRYIRAIYLAFFDYYASTKNVRGGSGHYNEQCHPSTYG